MKDGMQVMQGESILPRVAMGRLQFYRRRLPEFSLRPRGDADREAERFLQAQAGAVEELMESARRAEGLVGRQAASVFQIHAVMLQDLDYVHGVEALIRSQGVSAEYAVYSWGRRLAAVFACLDSPYMRARAADLRDISGRVLRHLLGEPPAQLTWEGPAILVSDEFLPSDLFLLEAQELQGVIATGGSVDSHMAMLLRAMDIPGVAGVRLLEQEWEGTLALLDGRDGRIYLEPEDALMAELQLCYEAGRLPERK